MKQMNVSQLCRYLTLEQRRKENGRMAAWRRTGGGGGEIEGRFRNTPEDEDGRSSAARRSSHSTAPD